MGVGECRYIEIKHIETTRKDHLTVGFSLVPDNPVAKHHNAMKET